MTSQDIRTRMVERLRGGAKRLRESGGLMTAERFEEAADRIEELEAALDDLADAARSACDARQHTSLIDALAEADRLTLRSQGIEGDE